MCSTRNADGEAGTGAVTDGGEPQYCAVCGAEIATDEWHPASGAYEDDEFRIYAFCSENCREQWAGSAREGASGDE